MNRRELLTGIAVGVAGCAAIVTRSKTEIRGLWRDDQGFLGVGHFPEFGEGLYLFDYVAERMVALRGLGLDQWEVCATLVPDGNAVDVLALTARGLRLGSRVFRPVTLHRQPLRTGNRGVELYGEWVRPAIRKNRGTILMVYGSGPAKIESFDPWAMWFLALGYAVIAADKRGCGRSQGDWQRTGLSTLADDATAMLATAKSMGATGPYLGWGASQAGWILPQLGARGDIEGFVMQAGALGTPAEQMLGQVDAELRAYGFEQADIEAALDYYRLDIEVARGRRPFGELESAYQRATAAGVEWLLEPPAAIDSGARAMIGLMADFDPTPYWRANAGSVLALYGGKDLVVPAEGNLERLRGWVPASLLSSHVFPSANHLMFDAQTGLRTEYRSRAQLAPGYLASIRAWLA